MIETRAVRVAHGAREVWVVWRGGDYAVALDPHTRPAQVWDEYAGEWVREVPHPDPALTSRCRYALHAALDIAERLTGE